MTGHIDQLTEWYESAERITKTNLPGDGDFIIYPHRGGIGYIIERSEGGWTSEIVLPDEDCRILSRAPKPEPAWHDAIAVIAWTDLAERQVWEREPDGTYSGRAGDAADGYELRDVTPLIEAKVTDEMVERALGEAEAHGCIEHVFGEVDDTDRYIFRAIVTAALGLETE